TLVSLGGASFSPATVVARDLTLTAAATPAAGLSSTGSAEALGRHADPLDRLDRVTAKWIAAYLDPEPLWRMPSRDDGFYHAFRTLAPHDPDLTRGERKRMRTIPLAADDALRGALAAWRIPAEDHDRVLRNELAQLPGWVAHIKWRAEHRGDIDLTSYLTVRLVLRQVLDMPPTNVATTHRAGPETIDGLTERARAVLESLTTDAAVDSGDLTTVRGILAVHPPTEHASTWQRAYEIHYRDALLASLGSAAPLADERPTMQVVLCIDARSEGMRRLLERNPDVETFGAAGFFGVPIRFARHGARGAIDALPALLTPRHTATERPVDNARATRHTARLRRRSAFSAAVHSSENGVIAPFAFAEAAGALYGLATLVRTLTPRTGATVRRRLAGLLAPTPDTTVTIADAFTLEERVVMAETLLRMIGMTRFAPLVVLTGHGSTTTNNLFESALHCGACGGNSGDANARAAAAIFNDPEVREQLSARGIVIPGDTVFVAAEHDTTTDTVTLLDQHAIPAGCAPLIDEFHRLHRAAGDALIRERAASLPGASSRHRPRQLRRRAHDWAEVYPEWGLAGNAAMIVGPRAMTRGVNLHRRVFLHSYQTAADPDGTGLESILTAPVVVAQWINHQYYFSAIDPERYGAGTKTLHNAIGTLGVLTGASGDLRRGLPWQSVGVGSRLIHEPMRLTVVVEAPLTLIGEIVSRNQVLRNLFDNSWLMLIARDDEHSPWTRYTPYGWRPWTGHDTQGEPA
ncbi:MAG TPA: putative inorganic carbon transporter subunit DabA, partial [Pseudolysinimonas sp.]|nr:putative inorganic carbon transporter subunit DabA [Pseudolysinimonas sp.]